MARFVAADASTLIGLAVAGAFDLLGGLFATVTITHLVKDEVAGRGDRPGARELDAAMRAGWIRVAPAPPETWRFAEIDAGEASTIALAVDRVDALVLMDDALGRAQAAALGLEVMDLAGRPSAQRSSTLCSRSWRGWHGEASRSRRTPDVHCCARPASPRPPSRALREQLGSHACTRFQKASDSLVMMTSSNACVPDFQMIGRPANAGGTCAGNRSWLAV
jgi:predicted nucleic acid-binding protein